MESTNEIVGKLHDSVLIVDRRTKKRSADAHAIVLVAVVFVVIVIIVATLGSAGNSRIAEVIRIPVKRTRLIGKIKILDNSARHDCPAVGGEFQTPQTIKPVQESDSRTVLPRLLKICLDFHAVAESVAHMYIPATQGTP